MRIAVVASPVTQLLAAQAGGAQAFVSDLAVGLARRGHEVQLHCVDGSEVPGVKLFTVPAPPDAAVALVMPAGRVPPPAPGVAAALARMFESVLKSKVDVVSQHAFDAPAFELAWGLPVLHTLHLPPLVPAVTQAAGRYSASSLATVSESCRSGWRSVGVEVAHVLPNGIVDVEVGKPQVENVALLAGRISPEKGLDHALAAARAAGLEVRVVGAHYDPSYEVDLTGAQVLGPLPRAQLRWLMAASAVTVCAVRWEEPFGMVAAEAQMAGCPVAAYRRGALPEVVEEGVSGFLARPDDVAALALAIERCLALDRAEVRASARRRLGFEAALDGYEGALRAAAS